MKVKSLSCVQLFATPWTAAYQAPPSMEFSRQEYWSGLPLPSPNLEDGSMIKTQARDVEHLQAEEGRGRVSLGDLQKTPSPAGTWTSAQGDLVWILNLQNHKMRNYCCFKSVTNLQ